MDRVLCGEPVGNLNKPGRKWLAGETTTYTDHLTTHCLYRVRFPVRPFGKKKSYVGA